MRKNDGKRQVITAAPPMEWEDGAGLNNRCLKASKK
jgi:hypothetical protein